MNMIRAIVIFALLFFAVFNADKLLATIQLSDEMTMEEQQTTGIDNLSDSQKQALEKWINEKFILKSTATDTSPITLQQNMNNGSQLELSNGSIYEIAPSDKAKTLYWLTPIEIKISPSDDPMFPYSLTNTLSGVSVRAKQLRKETIKPQKNPKL